MAPPIPRKEENKMKHLPRKKATRNTRWENISKCLRVLTKYNIYSKNQKINDKELFYTTLKNIISIVISLFAI